LVTPDNKVSQKLVFSYDIKENKVSSNSINNISRKSVNINDFQERKSIHYRQSKLNFGGLVDEELKNSHLSSNSLVNFG